jgi:hypothetical protein
MAWQMMAAQGAMNVMGSVVATRQAAAQSKAARAQALAEIDRLHREAEQVRDQYRGAKDDRARAADYQMGAMIAAMADNGGMGTQNMARMAAEVSFFEGLDIGRLEQNRLGAINTIKSQQVAANQNALNIQTKAWQGAMSSWMNTGASAAQSYMKHEFAMNNSPATQQGTIQGSPTGRMTRTGYTSGIRGGRGMMIGGT